MTARWRLSRFAFVHLEAGGLVAESARGASRVSLDHPSDAAVVAALARPCTVEELAHRSGCDLDHVRTLTARLADAGLVEAVDDEGRLAEDRDAALRQWEFHDRLFHARNRPGPHAARSLTASEDAAVDVPLFVPSAVTSMASDPAIAGVIESRRSIRRFGDPPVTLRQLGEFLYRVSDRPRDTLSVYVTIDRCVDLDAGLYRYVAGAHGLARISHRTGGVDALLAVAKRTGSFDPPQVLLTITARRHAGVSYADVLVETGALYQTMYLAATAMGLAACANGYGDAALFARASGTDPLAEPAVGEFVVGSARS